MLTSGITCALGAGPAAAVAALLAEAREAGARTAFDVNFRSRLWTWEEAAPVLRGVLERVDVLLAGRHDLERILGEDGEPVALAKRAIDAFGHSLVVLRETETVGPARVEVAVTAVTAADVLVSPTYEAEVVDAFGGGDAALGALLAALLDGEELDSAIDRAAWACAFQHTTPGDAWQGRPADLEQRGHGRAPRAAVIVDGHLHVFRPADVLPRDVSELVPAERDAPVGDLLATMVGAGVQRAVLVPLGTEDDYVAEVLGRYPGRFAAIAVADAALQGRDGGDPVAALQARRAGFPFHGVRTQWLGDPAAPLADSPMLPALRRMAELDLVLWTYLTPDQLGAADAAPRRGARPAGRAQPPRLLPARHARRRPRAARVRRPVPRRARWSPCSRSPSTRYLMFSGQYALSSRGAAVPRPRSGRRAGSPTRTGRERMLWASDYPWTRDVPGYDALLSLAEQALPGASAADLAAIHGGTALRLFPHLEGA